MPTSKSVTVQVKRALIGLGIAGSLVGIASAQPKISFAHCAATDIQVSVPNSTAFTLRNHRGELATERDTIIEPTLVYFGYTYCPDICPLDTTRNAETVDLLQADGHSVTPLFITIDPERDGVEEVVDYALAQHDKMIGMTGSEADVAEAIRNYDVFALRQDGDDEYYAISHSAFTYLVLPDAGHMVTFTRDLTATELADKVACFVGDVQS